MWIIPLSLVLGIALGMTINFSEKFKFFNKKLQYLGVLVLLFIMGAKLGLDKTLLINLKPLGFKSLVFAILTSIFSIFMVYLVTAFIYKGEKRK